VLPGVVPNVITSSYTIGTGSSNSPYDRGQLLVFNSASSLAITLNSAASYGSNFYFLACNANTGTATISISTSTITYTDGVSTTSSASSAAVAASQCLWVFSDNTNYRGVLFDGNAGQINGAAVPASANLAGTNSSKQIISEETDLGSITYNASGTTTFAAASAFVAAGKVTTTHSTSTTFSPTGLVKWGSYTVEILQDGTGGSVTFTLGTGGSCSAWKVGGGGSGAITLSSGANAIDVLAFSYDGTNCIANFRTNFD
jgi:hypothetical protein